jgi:hypothetical protein
MAAVSFRDVAVPEGGQACCLQPVQVGGGVGVVPEHVGTEVWRGAGPLPGSDDGQEIAARAKPASSRVAGIPAPQPRSTTRAGPSTAPCSAGG